MNEMNEMKKISNDEYSRLMNKIKERERLTSEIKEREQLERIKEIQDKKRKLRNAYKKHKKSSINLSHYSRESKLVMKDLKQKRELEKEKRKKSITNIENDEIRHHKFEILEYLINKDFVSINEIIKDTKISYGTCYHHLNKLINDGFVILEVKNDVKNKNFYKVSEKGLIHFKNYSGKYQFSEIQEKILEKLKKKDYTRKELMDSLHIAWTTLFDNLDKLRKLKYVIDYTVNINTRGRPKTYWKLIKNVELIK